MKRGTWKPTQQEVEFPSLRTQKTFKIGSQNQPKIHEKSCSGTPRVHPAAPMILQGALEVSKWPQGAKMEAPSSQLATARS